MTSKKPVLHETYNGYKIYHRPWIKRRPWRCDVPARPGHQTDKETLESCWAFIDKQLMVLNRQEIEKRRAPFVLVNELATDLVTDMGIDWSHLYQTEVEPQWYERQTHGMMALLPVSARQQVADTLKQAYELAQQMVDELEDAHDG